MKIISLKIPLKESASFRRSETIHKHKGTLETRHSFQTGTGCTQHNQKLKGRTPTGPLNHQDLGASFPLIVSSHHNPLLSCHGPSKVRGEHSCRDSRPLGSNTHCQASCISWHSMSRAMRQLKATTANSQSFKKREILSPTPYNLKRSN